MVSYIHRAKLITSSKQWYAPTFKMYLPICTHHAHCKQGYDDLFPNGKQTLNIHAATQCCGPGSSVSTATELRDGRSGDRIPVGARFSAPVQVGPGVHQASCTMGTGSLLGVKSGRGVTLIPHPLLVPRSKNRVELYLYSP
jgi:hypothetical protein